MGDGAVGPRDTWFFFLNARVPSEILFEYRKEIYQMHLSTKLSLSAKENIVVEND